ncbi:MAG: site-specific integrase [Crocinitomicaceae bacterium]|nr:site-specific integrase [Crocinitomicaceae bacterium]
MNVALRERKGKKRTKGNHKGKQVIVFYLDYYSKEEGRFTETLPIKYIPGSTEYGDYSKQKAIANQIRIQRESELLYREFSFLKERKESINFIEYFNDFVENYQKGDLRMFKATKSILVDYMCHNGFDIRKHRIKDISPDFCRGFANYLKNSHLTGETPYNYFSKFNSVLISLKQKELLQVNPVEMLRPNEKVKRLKNHELTKQILTIEELRILQQTPCGNSNVSDAFFFACFTGLGLAELRQLDWTYIIGDCISIRRQKTNTLIQNTLPKSALNILSNYKEKDGLIFKLPSTNSVNKTIKRWIARAKIKKHITFYCARHTFAVMLLSESQTNLKTVADCLGHTTTAHTLKYLNHVNELKVNALNKLPCL